MASESRQYPPKTLGPRTQTSPTSPFASLLCVWGSKIPTSTPGSGRPTLPGLRVPCSGFEVLIAVSVRPYRSTTAKPNRSWNRRKVSGESGAEPQVNRRIDPSEKSPTTSIMRWYMVGTPMNTLMRSAPSACKTTAGSNRSSSTTVLPAYSVPYRPKARPCR